MTKLGYSMQDWFLRIAFAPSCAGEDQPDAPIAETHNMLLASDFDVVINSKWAATASEEHMAAVLRNECEHAITQFLNSRYGRGNGQNIRQDA